MNHKEVLTFSHCRVVKETVNNRTSFTVENSVGVVEDYIPVAVFYNQSDLVDYLYRTLFDLNKLKIDGDITTWNG